jgi:predicted transcriptional regulator of viral defense system
MAAGLGTLESQFFAYIQMRRLQTVRYGQIADAIGISPQQERELLSRLARRSLIARVRRGLYLVPPRLPPGGKWSPGEFLAIATLIDDQGGRYQICGPSAFSRYGWDNQVPNGLYAYNNRISGARRIGSTALSLIRLADQRLGETEAFKTPDGVEAIYSSRIRSLVDAVYDWSRFNSLPQAYSWIRQELARNRAMAGELVEVALKYSNVGTWRRLGRLLELESVEESILRKIERQVTASSSLIPWVPTLPRRGTVDRRWGILVNDGQ